MAQTTAKQIKIGDWLFDPGQKCLKHTSQGHTIKLEDKISALLLCLHTYRGTTVSKDKLIEEVWDGRELSEQTIPVAISKLRKALNDDINQPVILATVPRQGYRLLVDNDTDVGGERHTLANNRFRAHFAAVLLAVATATTIVWWSLIETPTDALTRLAQIPNPTVIVTVNDVRTNSDTDSMMPQAIATSELISYFLSQSRDIQVIRHWWNLDAPDPTGGIYTRYGERTPIYSLKPKLVMDAGRPTVTLVLSNPKTDEVIWSGLHDVSGGSPNLFAALADMIQKLGIPSAIPIQTGLENDVRYWNARYFTHLSNKGAAYNAATHLRELSGKPTHSDSVKLLATGLAARWQPNETDTDAFTSLNPLIEEVSPKSALEIELRHTEYADYAAIALYRDGDLNTAEKLLDRALAIAPGDHHSLFLLGEVYSALKKTEAARESYSRAYRLAPFARVYQSKLASLKEQGKPVSP